MKHPMDNSGSAEDAFSREREACERLERIANDLQRNLNKALHREAILRSSNLDLIAALEGIIAITDRKHVAWDKAHAALKKAEIE